MDHPHDQGPQRFMGKKKEALWQHRSVLSPQSEAAFSGCFATKANLAAL